MPTWKNYTIESSAVDAINAFYIECEEIREEVSEVVYNAEHMTPRLETLSDAADALEFGQPENLDLIETDYVGAPTPIKYSVRQYSGKGRGREGRASRIGNAINGARAGVEALREWLEAEQEKNQEELKTVVKADDSLSDAEHREEILSDLEEILNEVEEHIEAADGAEFPGQFG